MIEETRVAIGKRPAQNEADESAWSELSTEQPVVETAGELIVIYGDKIHIWHDGTHYIEVGEADELHPGDVFFESGEVGYRLVEVTDVDSSKPDHVVGSVTVDLLYDEPSVGTDGESTDVEFHKQMLTGVPPEDAPMGYTGPPTQVEEVNR